MSNFKKLYDEKHITTMYLKNKFLIKKLRSKN